jgi:hypothetical protein
VHGLLGILPKQVGITYDSLLTGTPCWRLVAAEPVPAGTSNLYRIAHSLSLRIAGLSEHAVC